MTRLEESVRETAEEPVKYKQLSCMADVGTGRVNVVRKLSGCYRRTTCCGHVLKTRTTQRPYLRSTERASMVNSAWSLFALMLYGV